jgi:hypothetical protein
VGVLKMRGILMGAKDDYTIRACTHYMITNEAVEYTIKALAEVMVTLYD